MTWLTLVLGGLLLMSSALAVAAQRRYLALLRRHKNLQRLYDKAEQQLSTLWKSKKPSAGAATGQPPIPSLSRASR